MEQNYFESLKQNPSLRVPLPTFPMSPGGSTFSQSVGNQMEPETQTNEVFTQGAIETQAALLLAFRWKTEKVPEAGTLVHAAGI